MRFEKCVYMWIHHNRDIGISITMEMYASNLISILQPSRGKH
jgi:hypothetical protein